jgi:hypothetical protein
VSIEELKRENEILKDALCMEQDRLSHARHHIQNAQDRIKRLEETLAWYEYTVSNCYCHGSEGDAARDALRKDQGRKAKEAKL